MIAIEKANRAHDHTFRPREISDLLGLETRRERIRCMKMLSVILITYKKRSLGLRYREKDIKLTFLAGTQEKVSAAAGRRRLRSCATSHRRGSTRWDRAKAV